MLAVVAAFGKIEVVIKVAINNAKGLGPIHLRVLTTVYQ